MRAVGDFLVFALLWSFTLPWRILPYRACLALGRALTAIVFPIARKHRRIAEENLRRAFPDRDDTWYKQIVRAHFRHLGHMLADALYGPRLSDRFFAERVDFEPGSKEIEAAAVAEDTGIVLMTGHLGTWELLVQYTGRVMNGAGIYKPLSNRFVDRWYKSVRETSGITLFTMEETSKVVRWLRKGGFVGMVTDQNAGRAGIFVDFMNRPASTYLGPVVLAELSGSRILFYSAVHRPGGRITIRIQDIGRLDKATKAQYSDRDAMLRAYTEKWTAALEEAIHSAPEQYFWVHRRWKTQPQDVTDHKPQGLEKTDPAEVAQTTVVGAADARLGDA